MDTVWTFRIILVMAILIFYFGDYLEYRNKKKRENVTKKRSSTTIKDHAQMIDLDDDASNYDIKSVDSNSDLNINKKLFKNRKIAAQRFTDECLPKMLCQMAAKPSVSLNDKERSLLDLIKSTTLSLAWNSAPTKWHFATHMGQLMQYTADSKVGPMGCALLWPQCPISSQQLLRLSSKLVLK